MTAQFTLVPAEEIHAIRQQLDTLVRLVEQSHIQRAPEWVTVQEAARNLDCSPDTIRRRVERGEMEAKGAGKARRVRMPR